MNKIVSYFIPFEPQRDPEVARQYKLVVAGVLLTSLFVADHALFCIFISYWKGCAVLTSYIVYNHIVLLLIRRKIQLLVATNLYVFGGVVAILVSTYYSGGFHSTVLPVLATSPFVALLLAGLSTGFFWLIFNLTCVIIMAVMSINGYHFPTNYDLLRKDFFDLNNCIGLIALVFFVGFVLENGRRTALIKLNEQSQLLAEEKRKTALYEISQELHDNIGQILTLVKINLHTAKLLQSQNLTLKLDDTLDLVSKAMKDVREISHNLNAENITDFDLIKALKGQTDTITRTGVYVIDLKISGIRHKFKPQTEFILFRVIQEILNNIIKHAQANIIHVLFNYESKQLSLTIADNGIGISNEKLLLDGQGIRTMRSRIEVIGGSFTIASKRTGGTVVGITVPIVS